MAHLSDPLTVRLDRAYWHNHFPPAELSSSGLRNKTKAMIMKAYIANLPTAVWALMGLPALIATRCVVAMVVPQVVHAVVPEVVRTVLRVI